MIPALLFCFAVLASPESMHDETYLAWVAGPADIAELPKATGQRLTADELAKLAAGQPITPFAELTAGVRTADGGLWVGSPGGLMYLAPGAARWRLFHSRRWLSADDVADLAVTTAGDVIVKTSAGFGRIARRESTLEKKMIEIDDHLQKYHLRDGLVAATNLKEPGNVETGRVESTNDNDGLWTCMYVAAEAFRYGATQDPAAKRNARRSLEAIMFLERISGIPGFAARSFVPIDDDPRPHGGEWHRSSDGRYWWKGDTSSDEVVGHYFAYAVYYNVAASEEEKLEIRGYVERITDHILDHDLHYVGPPGKPTTWGVWAPEKLNHDLRRFGDRGLNSLEILSHLKVAEQIVGKPRYTQRLKELVEKHSYHINTVGQKQVWPVERINHSDDELAFLSYYPLLVYERDPALREVYLASIRRSWLIERPEGSPLFNLIFGAALQASTWTDPAKRPERGLVEAGDYDRDVCREWFCEVPQDTTHWTVRNSGRRDIVIAGHNRFRGPRGDRVLPVSERHVMRWNGDPYTLDGGADGHGRDDGAAILLPYWMGRWHRLME